LHERGLMINVHTDRSERGLVLGNKVLAAQVFAKNGFLVLSSVTGEEKTAEVKADQINQGRGDDDSHKIDQ
jgi:hypothetical protein